MTTKASGGPALVIPWVLPVGEVWEDNSEFVWLLWDHSVEHQTEPLPLGKLPPTSNSHDRRVD